MEICCKVDTVRRRKRPGDRKDIQAHCWKEKKLTLFRENPSVGTKALVKKIPFSHCQILLISILVRLVVEF